MVTATLSGDVHRISEEWATRWDRMNFGEKLKALLQAKRLSQATLAVEVGIWQSRVSELIQGARPKETALGQVVTEVKIEPSVLVKIADTLGVPIRYLADPTITDPGQVEDQEGLSEKEKYLLATARVLGHDEAVARLLGKAASAPRQAELPLGEQPAAPGPRVAKSIGVQKMPKRAPAKAAARAKALPKKRGTE